MSRLHLPEGLRYACVQCGRSCGFFGEICVDPEDIERVRALPPEAFAGARETQSPIIESPWTPGERIMRLAEGRCCLQRADGLCAIHAACGCEAKPAVCRDFPYKFIQTPDGDYVGLSFACTAVLENAGPPVSEQAADLEQGPRSRSSRRAVREDLALAVDIPLSWPQYLAIEEDLAALLEPKLGPLGQRLVLQSVYLRLLIRFLRQARAQAGALAAGPEANTEPLAVFRRQLRGEDGRGGELLETLRRIASRRRPTPMLRRSLLGFAHTLQRTYTRRLGRLASYARTIGHYFMFAAGRGAVELDGKPPVPLVILGRVRFDPARPDHDELLTRYWRHRLFRKDLATADSVQSGHNLQLMHWGLIHWHAAALAAGEGAGEITRAHLAEAISLLERHYVFHSSFDRIFSHYPLLRGFMERIFQNPHYAFAMGWGEWHESP